MASLQPKGEQIKDLVETIQFTEMVSTKIHGLRDTTAIFQTVSKEFTSLQNYIATILLLSDDGESLSIECTSLPQEILQAMEAVAGVNLSQFRINLDKTSIFAPVIAENETVLASGADIIMAILPKPLAGQIITALGDYISESSIITPIYLKRKPIGVFVLTSHKIADQFMPSVRNLAWHISTSLDLAHEYHEHQITDAALQKQEAELQFLFDSIEDGMVVVNLEGITTRVNEATIRMGGFESPNEIIGRSGFDFVDEADRPRLFGALSTVIETGRAGPIEFMVNNRKGDTFPAEAVATLLRDAEDNPTGAVAIYRDITERKKVEEALHKSEAYYRSLIENATDMIIILNKDATIRYASPSIERIAQYQTSNLLGLNAFDFIHPDDKQYAMDVFNRGVTEPGFYISFETRLARADGTWRYVALSGKNLLDDPIINGAVLNFQDIEERKQAEKALIESEAKYRSLFEGAGTPITYVDLDGNIVMINGTGARNLGGEPKDFVGKSIYEVFSESAEMHRERFQKVLETGVACEYEDAMELPTGTLWFLSTLHPVRDVNNSVTGVQIISQDITQRKRTEERIQHLNAVLRAVRNINELIMREDDQGRMIQESCQMLVQTRGYKNAWIVLMDVSGQLQSSAEAGIGNSFVKIELSIKKGKWPDCAQAAFDSLAPIVIDNKPEACSGCPLASECGSNGALSVRLEYGGRVYGVLCVGSAYNHYVGEEERALFEEVAGDIAFALQGVELEDERVRAEEVLRESEDRFREVFENANDEIIHLSADGTVIDVNRKIEDIFGYKREEVIGKKYTELGFFIPDNMPAIVDQFGARFDAGSGTGLAEFEGRHKNGEKVYVEASVSPIKKRNKIKGVLIILRDITARKEMEERISQYSSELEQRLEELQQAYEQLKELDRMKDSFLSTVSHELRTPLTSIKSFSEILLTYESDQETQKEFLQIINDESDRLTRLINDTLDLSKIESGQMHWETTLVDISDSIHAAVNNMASISSRMNLTVHVKQSSVHPKIWGDNDRFLQVMTNLLSNAVKFSQDNGEITIQSQTLEPDDERHLPRRVQVSITDNGRGIAPQDQEMIFQKFTQVGDTLRDKPPGTGLGLPICKEIIEHYGGTVSVESQLGEGSTFTFWLPVAWQDETVDTDITTGDSEEEEPGETPKGQNKILIVDDEANIRRFLKHELKRLGYYVIEAANGNEAIRKVKKHAPDLITLDIILPDVNGFAVVSKLKEDPDTRNIPIIIVSILDYKQQALALGVDDFVTKPFSDEVILEKISTLLRNPKGTILVVDDDESLVRSITFELQHRGYTTYVAHDGEEAITATKDNKPDLIVLDIMMPKMDGHEVIRTLKSQPDTSDIPIIVLTGVEVAGGKVKALSLGANDFITKSGGLSKLFETAASILDRN